jgi:hypothetical protein
VSMRRLERRPVAIIAQLIFSITLSGLYWVTMCVSGDRSWHPIGYASTSAITKG